MRCLRAVLPVQIKKKKTVIFYILPGKLTKEKLNCLNSHDYEQGKGENKKRRNSVNAVGFVRVVFANPVFLPVFKDF